MLLKLLQHPPWAHDLNHSHLPISSMGKNTTLFSDQLDHVVTSLVAVKKKTNSNFKPSMAQKYLDIDEKFDVVIVMISRWQKVF